MKYLQLYKQHMECGVGISCGALYLIFMYEGYKVATRTCTLPGVDTHVTSGVISNASGCIPMGQMLTLIKRPLYSMR